ncbi:metalloprotease [Candidatus Cardinium hertigii]|uniref:metalloprotease n=1 Tax=Candidatus Cardinium hertigii TaxID=247481 RepID=UPI001622C686|nr:site-2 protease family protein [Candidatus Cardinium hertigii]
MHFRFLKVSVYIDLSFWISLLFVIGITSGPYRESLLLAIVFTFSLFIHEYGHALAALFFSAEPVIVLQAFSGRTTFNKSVITDKQNFLITLSGPLLQGLVVLGAYLLFRYSACNGYIFRYLLFEIIRINTTWTLLNLIPIEPLDGGYLVRYILEKAFGRKGHRASIIIGLAAAAVAIPYLYVYGHYLSFFFIGQLLISGFQYCSRWQKEQEW